MADIGSSGVSNSRYPYYYGPEGRLLLVDSALEAVGRGSTTVGIKTSTFALIASHIKPTKPLVEPSEKIFTIDGHVGATGSGYIGDILQLIDEMRIAAQKYRFTYDSPIDIKSLARQLSSYLHDFTIYAVRPQAASIIIAGLDPAGIQLYQVDPSGTYFSGSGFAIGQYSDTALDTIQKEYTEDITIDQAVQLSDRAIEKALGETPLVERGIVMAKDAKFNKMVAAS
jgi:proteasome alpha subunit